MFNKIFLFLFVIILNINSLKALTIKALVFTYTEKTFLYTPLMNAFNKYSIENNLDIQFELTLLTPQNATSEVHNTGYFMDSLLEKGSDKYDLYFYYGSYSKRYGPHLIDLRQYIPDEHISMYDSNILDENCSFEDKLVGLPISIDIGVLYSNQILLSKYGKQIPKTWDQVIETGSFILQKEKEENNNDLIGYNGLMNESNGMVSAHEFIHSFRESNDAPHPEILSEKTETALETFKRLKDEISSDDTFQSGDEFTIEKLLNGRAIFLKFWYMKHIPIYVTSALPGEKEGVSGSVIYGNNIGICRYIKEENIEAAAKVIQFLTSREVQKNVIINNDLYSGINDLYMDEEVCEKIECNIIMDVQPLSCRNMDFKDIDQDYYLDKYEKNIMDYMYHDKPLSEVLRKIDNLLKFHSFTLRTDETYLGLIFFIIVIILIVIMLASLVFLFLDNYSSLFEILPKDFWILTVFGSISQISGVFVEFGELTDYKCEIQVILIDFGLILSLGPILYRLIVNFPDINKYSQWVDEHRYHFLLCLSSISFILYGLMFLPTYTIKNIVYLEGENVKLCKMNGVMGVLIVYSIILVRTLSLLAILLLLFMEWNISNSKFDVKIFTGAILMNIFSLLIYYITDILTIKNYRAYYSVLACSIIIISVSNFFFLYGARIPYKFMKNEEEETSQKFLKSIKLNTEKFSNGGSSRRISEVGFTTRRTSDAGFNSKKTSEVGYNSRKTSEVGFNSRRTSDISNIIISYHFRESID